MEEIDYNDLNNITDLQEMWAKDICVDKAKSKTTSLLHQIHERELTVFLVKEFLQLAQGFIEEHSVVLL